jgi:hypothetical protein
VVVMNGAERTECSLLHPTAAHVCGFSIEHRILKMVCTE